jgi:predicted ester cyclase
MNHADLREAYLAYLEAANDRAFHRMAVDSVRDYHWRLDDLIIEGDRVAARLTVTGTPVKEWLGLRPTGRDVSFTECAFYHFRDGRFEHMWYLLDTRTIEKQLAA